MMQELEAQFEEGDALEQSIRSNLKKLSYE